MPYQYDSDFFGYTCGLSAVSAKRVSALLVGRLNVGSILDVGCGEGVWLAAWQEAGVADIQGVDGDYVNRDRLRIPKERFLAHDLAQPFNLDRQFDLVQSLEVAEHLKAEHAQGFVASLVAHSKLVLFSAAPPGQGGENHINEQPYDYWRGFFAAHDYCAVDWVRPALASDPDVAPWYRYNTVLYVHESRLETLSEDMRRHMVAAGQAIPDISPLSYRLRKAAIACLPFWLTQGLAKAKARLAAR